MERETMMRAIGGLTQLVEKQLRERRPNPRDKPICALEDLRRLKSPSFVGTTNPLVAESWMMQLEKIFDVLDFSETQKVTYAVFMLEEEAEHWWRMVKRTHFGGMMPSWVEIGKALFDKYFPTTMKFKKEELMHLIQGSMTVSEYETKFIELSRFAPYMVADEVNRAR